MSTDAVATADATADAADAADAVTGAAARTVDPAALPGLSVTRAARPVQTAPLRSDVAGFAGRLRRGPVGQRLRVRGWKDCQRQFGGLHADADLSYALRGYFENGGEIAHVVRLGHPALAAAVWTPPYVSGDAASPSRFVRRYRVEASSPGGWAEGTRVHLRYRRQGASGAPELDLAIEAPGEPPEYLAGLRPGPLDDEGRDPLQAQVARRSTLLRLVPDGSAGPEGLAGPASWTALNRYESRLVLAGGQDGPPARRVDYEDALQRLDDEPEVALLALPDLYRDLGDDTEAADLLAAWLERVDAARDRLLLIDAPRDSERAAGSVAADALLDWLDQLRGVPPVAATRSAALYHPWLAVPDPLGGLASPLRAMPPSGHVAGLISRLDRERGPHHSPANAALREAVDLSERLEPELRRRLMDGAVNLLRCQAGDGLQVWGASTLRRRARHDPLGANDALSPDGFIAYRRLIHRLVRAIRGVAEPLVFDTNGPALWLAFVRAVTTVLLEAWRGGALQGARAEEAFQVRCDDHTNPPEEREAGRCVCEIALAPVAPMEFIVLRLALGGEGVLEVFES